MIIRFIFIAGLLFCQLVQISHAEQNTHPRFINNSLAIIHARSKTDPYRSWLLYYRQSVLKTDSVLKTKIRNHEIVPADDWAEVAMGYSAIFIIEGNEFYSERAALITEKYILPDTQYLSQPQSRGLNRASMLFNMTLVYDWCYNSWQNKLRCKLNSVLLQSAFSVSAGMGKEANTSLESNWNGVRWGSVLIASLLLDSDSLIDCKYLEYDSRERLLDHLSAFISSDGWPCEALGYLGYDSEFTFPALVYCTLKYPKFHSELLIKLPGLSKIPNLLAISTVSINGIGHTGFKPDFADDHIMESAKTPLSGLIGLIPDRISKEEILGTLKYISNNSLHFPIGRPWPIFLTIFSTDSLYPRNPNVTYWLDKNYGTACFRNVTRDSTDVMVAFQTSAKRCRGHAGPDNLGLRIIALDVPWVIGSGRTHNTTGQAMLIKKAHDHNEKVKLIESIFLESKEYRDGGGWIMAKESTVGVTNHTRKIDVRFPKKSNEVVKVIITDKSTDGYYWRISTPEFNIVNILKNGFDVVAPNGAIMKARIKLRSSKDPINITTGLYRYGGTTQWQNFGIPYKDKRWENLRWIQTNTGPKSVWELSIVKK